MKKFVIFLCGIALFFSSCSTLTKTANIANGVNTDVVINPIVADVDLAKADKIEGQSAATYLLWFRVSGDKKFVESPSGGNFFGVQSRTDKVRNAAVYNALSEKDYDVLAHPRYTTETTTHLFGLIKTYKVKVVGYGANIIEMHQVQPGEAAYDVLLYKNNVNDVIFQPIAK